MSYYSVLAVTPTTKDWIPGYIGPANELVAKHGGKYIARTSSHQRLEGEGDSAALQVHNQFSSSTSYKISSQPIA